MNVKKISNSQHLCTFRAAHLILVAVLEVGIFPIHGLRMENRCTERLSGFQMQTSGPSELVPLTCDHSPSQG